MKPRRVRPLACPDTAMARTAIVQTDFLRGFVAAGTLAAIQERGGKPRLDRRTLRLALQGGSALASGTAAARAWRAGMAGQALFNVALGAGAVAAIEHLLKDQDQETRENQRGQEEA